MTDKIKLVSNRNERDIATKRACAELNHAIKQLAANILRITAGAGNADRVIDQISPIVAAYEKLLKLTERPLTAEIQIEQALRSSDRRATDPDYSRPTEKDLALWEDDGSADVQRAEKKVIQAVCRLVAAQLSAQPSQEATSHNQFMTAMKAYEDAWNLHGKKLKRW